ncbi:hypothetical protein CON65_02415 [Bacillus pseudomycoides]|uniref:Uncharacterized protein n=1 Tax=Bacillus pseudomycoides TaxID=64104 RepID=A0AA91ZW10_9BACI|nr:MULTISPECIES: hypothetical protein [Bacillus]PED84308.1 hypothetical protein CON65_02415 [Bacillus pseudomycoides]PEU15835.1 hypothetical protein CN524_06120 [Bacillus sp. AFS019443]PEU19729.1 hypothetical protein CN525_06160 [Bacillus sp. AFS014408]PFW64865.1 hypothetical protein COL20_02440 [Bacillus sp. AFS075034]
MLWLLAYLIVGLLYTTIRLYPSICKVAQKNMDDAVWLIATIVISIAAIFFLIPFWIILLAFDVAKFFYKWRGKLHE